MFWNSYHFDSVEIVFHLQPHIESQNNGTFSFNSIYTYVIDIRVDNFFPQRSSLLKRGRLVFLLEQTNEPILLPSIMTLEKKVEAI